MADGSTVDWGGGLDPGGGAISLGVDPTANLTCDPTDPTCGGIIPSGCDPTVDPTCGGTLPSFTATATGTGGCDPTDPTCIANVPSCVDSLCSGFGIDPLSAYDPSLDPVTLQWCVDNPNECDYSGPTTSGLSLFCTDNPQLCGQSGSTVSTNPATIGGAPAPNTPPAGSGSGGGGGTSGGGGSAGGSAKPSTGSSNPLSNALNALKNLFTTCPAGYAKTSAGTCVRSASAPTQAGVLGLGSGSSILWVLLAVIAVAFIIKNKEAVHHG